MRVRERTQESDCCCMLACLDLEQKNQEEGDVGEKEMEVALKRNSGLLCTMRECAPTERVNCMHVCWVGVNESAHASGHALVHAATRREWLLWCA